MNDGYALLLSYAKSISVSLCGTLMTELPLAFLLGVRGRKNIGAVFIVNCLTNPTVVSIVFLLLCLPVSFIAVNIAVVILEILVVITEGAVYRRKLEGVRMHPYLLALILNAVSFGIGFLL